MDKPRFRQRLLDRRTSVSREEWRTKSDRLCEHLNRSVLFTQSQTILAYISHRQEADLSSLWPKRSIWGLPRTVGKSLHWHTWKPLEPLQTGKYGIFEPHPNSPVLEAKDVDLILVPAVACDRRGYRLGYGGGYYDRMLSSEDWIDIPTIGIIFDFALVEELPIDGWDIPLTAVCSDRGFSQLADI